MDLVLHMSEKSAAIEQFALTFENFKRKVRQAAMASGHFKYDAQLFKQEIDALEEVAHKMTGSERDLQSLKEGFGKLQKIRALTNILPSVTVSIGSAEMAESAWAEH